MAPLVEAAERLGIEPTHVLLTHHHFDHVSELGALCERWPRLEVLIHPLERELLAAMGDVVGNGVGGHDRGRGDAAVRGAGGAAAANARAHRGDAVVPRVVPSARTSLSTRPASPARSGAGRASRAAKRWCSPGDTLFKGSVGGVRAPGHTTYTDLRDSIMGTLMELPPETIIYPGHTDATTVAQGVGAERVHPRVAGAGRRGLEPVRGTG